jgi:phosphoglycerate kinase
MSEDFLTLDDVDVKDKRVLLRGDLNVPVEHGEVGDTTRLKRLVPTIKELQKKNAKVLLLSHFGRPKPTSGGGRDPELSLQQVTPVLQKLLGAPVSFCADAIGPAAQKAVAELKPGGVLVLENTRFYPGEEKNDPAFVRELADLGDVFVNDAFSVSHRAHASTEGLAHVLPSCAGRDMQEELEALGRALERPARPVMAIIGGSKISTKIDVLRHLIERVDVLVLGGGMANTFLAAEGKELGASLYEPDMLDTAREIETACRRGQCRLLLPSDVVVAAALKPGAEAQTVSVDKIPGEKMALDVGAETVKAIARALEDVKTVVWNGPLGVFEIPPFDKATLEIARVIAGLTQSGNLLSVAGGGDTVAAVNKANVAAKLTYVSSAGGAFLEWMEGKTLPGVAALIRAA